MKYRNWSTANRNRKKEDDDDIDDDEIDNARTQTALSTAIHTCNNVSKILKLQIFNQ
jgi:hypothetical protein